MTARGEIPFDAQITFLPSLDLDASSRFYAGVLGLALALDQGGCRIFRARSGAYIGICRRERVLPSDDIILTLVTQDVDACAARLRAHGVELECGPRSHSVFGIYHLFVRDPDGHRVEVQRFDDPAWAGDQHPAAAIAGAGSPIDRYGFLVLAHYNRWMNRSVFAAAARIDDAARRRDMGAFFGSIHGTLNHLLLADRLWLGRLTAAPVRFQRLDQELYSDFAALERQRVVTDQAIIAYCEAVVPADLDAAVEFDAVVTGARHSMSAWHALLHLFNHQTHHRGQVTTLLKQQGVDPGVTDLMWMELPQLPAAAR